jgi:hypothetical protein
MPAGQALALRILPTGALIPEAWDGLRKGPVRAFNPGLLKVGSGWLLAYRLVGADLVRRIGLCRLSESLQVVTGSALPFSDLVRIRPGRDYPEPVRHWFADPRLFRLGGRAFIYWNSGWHDPRNTQFIQEIECDELRPIGWPRELRLVGDRRKIEKNWMLFGEGPFHAVYSVCPHRILTFSLDGQEDIDCKEVAAMAWDDSAYGGRFGELRGGAPPQLVDGQFHVFCHSVCGDPGAYTYVPALYRFSSSFPFRPTEVPFRPLAFDNPFGSRTVHERLNPVVREVLYPAGAVFHSGRWIISLGINDEHCALTAVTPAEASATLRAAGGT